MVQKSGWKLVGLRGDDGGSLFKDSAFDQFGRFLRNASIHDVAFDGKERAPHEPSAGCPCEPRDDGEDDAGDRQRRLHHGRSSIARRKFCGRALSPTRLSGRVLDEGHVSIAAMAPMGRQRTRTSGAEGAQRGGGLLRLTRLCSPTDALSEAGRCLASRAPFPLRRTRHLWGLLKPRMVHIARADQIDGCD
jgi:hypothetical protein